MCKGSCGKLAGNAVEQLPRDERGKRLLHVTGTGNAALHKGRRIREILRKTHCLLVYLPPYVPQLNPVECCGLSAKRKVGQWLDRRMNLCRMVEQAFVEYGGLTWIAVSGHHPLLFKKLKPRWPLARGFFGLCA
ncbi:MAG: transposase [Cardiobacterium sp.]